MTLARRLTLCGWRAKSPGNLISSYETGAIPVPATCTTSGPVVHFPSVRGERYASTDSPLVSSLTGWYKDRRYQPYLRSLSRNKKGLFENMGQVNVNGPDHSNGNNGPYYRGPDRWEPVVRYVVWTICTLIVIAVLAYVGIYIFDHVVGTIRGGSGY